MWNLNDINGPDDMALEAEREMWDEIAGGDRLATESDAHAEWHRNAGVPMGTPGCPQDACHPDDEHGDEYEPVRYETARILDTRPAPTTVSFKRLRSGHWGVTGPTALVREGERLTVTKRDGRTSTVTVGFVVWHDNNRAIATIAR